MMRRFLRSLRVRPHMLTAAALGILTLALLPDRFGPATRALLAWNAGLCAYLVQIAFMVMRSDLASIRRHAPVYDEGASSILVLSNVAALASIGAVVTELASTSNAYGSWQIVLVGITLVLSWTFVHVMFALHYAHDFYASREATLIFPGDHAPLYGDFFYFAFVIGVANATADVDIVSPAVRRIAMLHGIESFVFNTTILAMAINIGAGLIGK